MKKILLMLSLIITINVKAQDTLIGKSYVIAEGFVDTDFVTKKPIKYIYGEPWKIVFVLNYKDDKPDSIIFSNPRGNKLVGYGDLLQFLGPNYLQLQSLEQFKKYNSKFGKEILSKMMWGSVWIGMTQELAKLSKGEPDKVNTTIISSGKKEQWVYRGQYLYFKNGKLYAIQKFD